MEPLVDIRCVKRRSIIRITQTVVYFGGRQLSQINLEYAETLKRWCVA